MWDNKVLLDIWWRGAGSANHQPWIRAKRGSSSKNVQIICDTSARGWHCIIASKKKLKFGCNVHTVEKKKKKKKKNINSKEIAKGAQPAHKRSLPSIDAPPICSWVLASPVRVRFSAFAFLFFKGFVTHGVRIKWKEWCVESRIDLQSHRDLWKRKSWAVLLCYPKRRQYESSWQKCK